MSLGKNLGKNFSRSYTDWSKPSYGSSGFAANHSKGSNFRHEATTPSFYGQSAQQIPGQNSQFAPRFSYQNTYLQRPPFSYRQNSFGNQSFTSTQKGQQYQPRQRKPVTSNNLSFYIHDGSRFRATFDAEKQSISVTLETSTRDYLTYGITSENMKLWFERSVENKPAHLPESNGVRAQVGSLNGSLMLQLSSATKEHPIQVSLTAGQTKLVDAFLEWSREAFAANQ